MDRLIEEDMPGLFRRRKIRYDSGNEREDNEECKFKRPVSLFMIDIYTTRFDLK